MCSMTAVHTRDNTILSAFTVEHPAFGSGLSTSTGAHTLFLAGQAELRNFPFPLPGVSWANWIRMKSSFTLNVDMSPLTGTKNIHSFRGVNVVNSWHRKRIIKTACALKKLLEQHFDVFHICTEIQCQQNITHYFRGWTKLKCINKPNLSLILQIRH